MFIEFSILLLVGASVAAVLAHKLKLPLELFLLIGSLGISLIPGLPMVTLEPDLVFQVFLPPILFAAAYFTSWRDFKFNLRPITLLAVGLVLFTTTGVAVVVHSLIPGVGWPFAFLLGAIVAPPDASAATSITSKVGMPRRIITILEGESLLNDATALVCYRFALAAIMSGTFSLGESILTFITVAIGGTVFGLFIAWLFAKILLRTEDVITSTLLSVCTSFIAYIGAEHFHFSGVISTVAAGLYFGRTIPASASAELRVEAEAFWQVLLLAVNGFVFALIGLQLPSALEAVRGYSMLDMVFIAVLLNVLLIVIRFIWVFPATYIPRMLSKKLAARDPAPLKRYPVLIAWTGMRGIVSMAAALAIPFTLPDGSPFPGRGLYLFLTFSVILGTLVIPTLTLPALMRFLKVEGTNEKMKEEALARVKLTEKALTYLQADAEKEGVPPDIVSLFLSRYERQLCKLSPNLSDDAYSSLDLSEQHARRLLLKSLELERSELLAVRKRGEIHDQVFHELSRELDREELRVRRNVRTVY